MARSFREDPQTLALDVQCRVAIAVVDRAAGARPSPVAERQAGVDLAAGRAGLAARVPAVDMRNGRVRLHAFEEMPLNRFSFTSIRSSG